MKKLTALLALIAAVAISGCDDNNSLAPFQPEVANNRDTFQFQITSAKKLTTAADYTWENTGTRATVNQSCAISEGAASISIHDSAGILLYSGNLADNGTFESGQGIAGNWHIHVEFSNMNGTVNFRVQKL